MKKKKNKKKIILLVLILLLIITIIGIILFRIYNNKNKDNDKEEFNINDKIVINDTNVNIYSDFYIKKRS